MRIAQFHTVNLERLPNSASEVLVAVNPIAGTGSRHSALAHLDGELGQRGLQMKQVTSLAELTIEAEAAMQRGQLRAVVAAGGDGTAAEIANRTPPETPLAIFPLGTENLLAKYLEIHRDAGHLAQIIADGFTARLDAGLANGRVFLLMASVGFDAEVVRRLHAERDGNISHWSYAKPILQTIRSYTYPELRVYYAPAELETEVAAEPIRSRWAFVFNLPRYGGGLKFAPAASGTDGLLDLCTFQRGGLFTGLRYLAAVVFGRHRGLREFSGGRYSRIRIESNEPVPYELDGDPGGMLPVQIETLPGRLRVLVSPRWSLAAERTE